MDKFKINIFFDDEALEFEDKILEILDDYIKEKIKLHICKQN